jgi:cell division protein FtsN
VRSSEVEAERSEVPRAERFGIEVGSITIQVGAYGKIENAVRVQKKILDQLGIKADMVMENGLNKIRISGILTLEEAQAIIRKLDTIGLKGARII